MVSHYTCSVGSPAQSLMYYHNPSSSSSTTFPLSPPLFHHTFPSQLSRTNAIKEEGDTSSDDEAAKKTASGESQSSLKGNPGASSSSSASSSRAGSQKQTQPTPPLSKKALMESLLLPETRTMFNRAKANEIFVDSANVKIVVSDCV